MKQNWGQFLAIVSIALIAVTLFLGLSANALSFDERVDRFYEQGNVSDIFITTNGNNDEILNTLTSNLKDDAYIEERGYIPSLFNNRDAFMGVSPSYPSICKPIIVEGGVDENNDFLIFDSTLSSVEVFNNTVAVGEVVSIGIPTSIIPSPYDSLFPSNDSGVFTLNFKTTGSMMFNENIENGAYTPPTFLISETYLKNKIIDTLVLLFPTLENLIVETVNNFSFINQYLIKLKDSSQLNQIKNNLVDIFKNNSDILSINTIDEMPFNMIIQSDIQQATQLTYVFPFFFFFVAILVILTTISQLIIKERTDIGTLKALGVPSKTIFLSYLILMLSLVGVGFVLGAIIGPLLIPYVMNIKYEILYILPNITYVFPTLYFFITFFILSILTTLVVFLACKEELKLSPAASMRPKKYKAIKSKNKNVSKPPKFLSLKMAFRNIRLNIVKSLMVIIGVTGCTALLVCGFGIDDTITYSINHTMDHFFSTDIRLTYTQDTPSIKDALLDIDGVKEVEEMRNASITIIGENNIDTKLYVVDGEHPFNKVDFDYDKIAISQKVAQDAHIGVGDEVTFSLLGINYQGEVGTIYDTFLQHGIYVNASYEPYASLYEVVNSALINVEDGYDIDEVANNIKNNVSQVGLAQTKEYTINYVGDVAGSIKYMTLTVKVFAILLAVVVLYNLAYLNFKERIRQMATLKVLGFSNFNIAKSLIYETMLLVFVGTIFGLLLGFPTEFLVLYINRNSIVEFLYTVTPLTYFISFLISFVTGLLINILLSLYIKNVKMVESLKSIE